MDLRGKEAFDEGDRKEEDVEEEEEEVEEVEEAEEEEEEEEEDEGGEVEEEEEEEEDEGEEVEEEEDEGEEVEEEEDEGEDDDGEEEEEEDTEEERDEKDPPLLLIPWQAERVVKGDTSSSSQQSLLTSLLTSFLTTDPPSTRPKHQRSSSPNQHQLSSAALPADVWLRVAHAVADSARCCSWPLIPSAIALPDLRRALKSLTSLSFDDSCRCPHSSIALVDRLGSFLWLLKRPSKLSHLSLSFSASPPHALNSFLRVCLRPPLSSLTPLSSLSSLSTLRLFFSRHLSPPPDLLRSIAHAPCLESLVLSHAIRLDGQDGVRMDGYDGPGVEGELRELIARMEQQWKANCQGESNGHEEVGGSVKGTSVSTQKSPRELIARMEQPGKTVCQGQNNGHEDVGDSVKGRPFASLALSVKDMPFASLTHLHITLSVCSSLVLRLLSCLAPQLLSLHLISSSGEFLAKKEEKHEQKDNGMDDTGGRARQGLGGDGGEVTGGGGVVTGDGGVVTGGGGVVTGDGGVVTGDGGVVTGDGGVVTGDGGVVTGGRGCVGGRIEAGTTFLLHLPLATKVSIAGIDCALSLSAPLLTSLSYNWWGSHSLLLLLPSSPSHLHTLSLTLSHSAPWAFHAPHLTSVDSLRTNMLPKHADRLPPGVVNSVKALQWEIRLSRKLSGRLDLSAWRSLCCFHLTGWNSVSLLAIRSGVIWPGGLEGLFVDCLGRDAVWELESCLRETDEAADGACRSGGTFKGEGSVGGRDAQVRGNGMGGREVQQADARQGDFGLHAEGQGEQRKSEVAKQFGCSRILWFEGWCSRERVLFTWDAAAGEGLCRELLRNDEEGKRRIAEDLNRFLKAKELKHL